MTYIRTENGLEKFTEEEATAYENGYLIYENREWTIDTTCPEYLTCKRNEKLAELKVKMQEYQDTYIKFNNSRSDYYIKSTDKTKSNILQKYNLIKENVVGGYWYADGVYIEGIATSQATKINLDYQPLLDLFIAIGEYFETMIDAYLDCKLEINSATTPAELEVIDLDSINWGSNDIGAFDNV